MVDYMDVYEFRTNEYDDCRAIDGNENENGKDSNKCEQNQGHSMHERWMHELNWNLFSLPLLHRHTPLSLRKFALPILSNPNDVHCSCVWCFLIRCKRSNDRLPIKLISFLRKESCQKMMMISIASSCYRFCCHIIKHISFFFWNLRSIERKTMKNSNSEFAFGIDAYIACTAVSAFNVIHMLCASSCGVDVQVL